MNKSAKRLITIVLFAILLIAFVAFIAWMVGQCYTKTATITGTIQEIDFRQDGWGTSSLTVIKFTDGTNIVFRYIISGLRIGGTYIFRYNPTAYTSGYFQLFDVEEV